MPERNGTGGHLRERMKIPSGLFHPKFVLQVRKFATPRLRYGAKNEISRSETRMKRQRKKALAEYPQKQKRKKEKRSSGSITVFLSLICIFFLALICTVAESARVQGARVQAQASTGAANYSLLSEYEKKLLDRYEIFAFDGGCEGTTFSRQKIEEKLKHYAGINADPKEGLPGMLLADPWQLTLEKTQLSEYELLTDDKGEPFYQQAVEFMKANLGAETIASLFSWKKTLSQIEESEESYQKRKQENSDEMKEAQKSQDQKESQWKEALEGGEIQEVPKPPQKVKNPLSELNELRKKGVLNLVTGGAEISAQKWKLFRLPSHSWNQRGGMKTERKQKGVVADLLFREYLLSHFFSYTDGEQDQCLNYQVEYLICGKGEDKTNLKKTVNRILLIREAMNYRYCASDMAMSSQAGQLAMLLTGWLGLPVVTEATKQALLLGWAYGESLVDVRSLLAKGSVPLSKTAATWMLSLENLGRLSQILQSGSCRENYQGEGKMTYRDYLRILLNMGSVSKQKMRALDLIQETMRQKEGRENFRAENCVTAVKSTAEWKTAPVFLKLPSKIMHLSSEERSIIQGASLSYHM